MQLTFEFSLSKVKTCLIRAVIKVINLGLLDKLAQGCNIPDRKGREGRKE